MDVGVIGVSYKEADIRIRDDAAFSDTKKMEFYNRLLDIDVVQAVIVSTCNRSELYVMYEEESQLQKLRELFLEVAGRKDIPLFTKTGLDAVVYLFEVALGYHSQVLGEDQILGQVADSYEMAVCAHACRKQMHRLFQSCIAVAKQVKHTYRISEHPLSIAYLAMKSIQATVSLQHARVMVIGSGEMAALMLSYLKKEDLDALYVCCRSREKAEKLLDENMCYVPFASRYDVLPQCDVICSMTASSHRILQRSKKKPTQRRQLYIDLAIPRDIDPNMQDECSQLIDIDHLQQEAQHHLEKRKQLMKQAHGLLYKEAQQVYARLCQDEVENAIQSLQQYSEQMAEDTFILLQKKLELSRREEQILKKVLHTSFLRMVKEPMLALKKAKGEDQQLYVALLETLLKGE